MPRQPRQEGEVQHGCHELHWGLQAELEEWNNTHQSWLRLQAELGVPGDQALGQDELLRLLLAVRFNAHYRCVVCACLLSFR